MRNETSTLSISEAELMHLAQKGHIGAFATLFGLHKSSVYSLCRRSTNGVVEAEELIQAVFLDVFRSLDLSPRGASFSELLYRSAESRIEMRERKKHLTAPFLDHLMELAAQPVHAPHSAPRFARMRDSMRSARAILSNQHA
jgi:DNA-directed RNA polymerase specialized sigma24 family protein